MPLLWRHKPWTQPKPQQTLATVTGTDELIAMALDLCENIADTYQQAPDHIRRLLNQLIFERIKVIYDEHEGEYLFEPEYTEAFAFLGNGTISTLVNAVKLADKNNITGIHGTAGSRKSNKTPKRSANKKPAQLDGFSLDFLEEALFSQVISSCKSTVVDLRGLEPLTPCMPCRCATSCATDPDC